MPESPRNRLHQRCSASPALAAAQTPRNPAKLVKTPHPSNSAPSLLGTGGLTRSSQLALPAPAFLKSKCNGCSSHRHLRDGNPGFRKDDMTEIGSEFEARREL